MRVRVGDLLVEQGLITQSQLDSALQYQKRHPGYRKLGETILALKLVTEEEMLRALARALRIKAVDLRRVSHVEPAALQTLSLDTAEKELVLPLRFVQYGASRRLHVAMADPTNLAAVDELQFRLGITVETSLSTMTQIRDAIRRFYRGGTLDMEQGVEITPDGNDALGERDEQRTVVGPLPKEFLAEGFGVRVVELKFLSGPIKGISVHVPDRSEMVFGRGQDVDYTVNDSRMSRRHFKVIAAVDSVELLDVGSSNGTFVNKLKVERVQLNHGDWIQAGSSLIRVGFVEAL